MCKKKKTIDNLLLWLGVFTLIVQVVLCVLWFAKTNVSYRGDILSADYIKATKTLVTDDYLGILYVLIVRTLGSGVLLYIFQTAFTFITSLFLAHTLGIEKRLGVILAGLIVTNPYVLSMEFFVSPATLILGWIFIALTGVMNNNPGMYGFAVIAMGFLNPDYAWICLAFSVVVVAFILIKKNKIVLWIVVCVISFVLPCTVNNVISSPTAYGRVEKTFDYNMMQRFCLGRLNENKNIIIEYYGRNFYNEMIAADRVTDRLATSFAYEFENYTDSDTANKVYRVMYKNRLAHGFKTVMPPVIKDYGLYAFEPASVLLTISQSEPGTHLSNPVYDFSMNDFAFGKIYLMFSAIATIILFVVGILSFAFDSLKAKTGAKYLSLLFVHFGLAAYTTLICVVGFDYRNLLFGAVVWMVIAFIPSTAGGDE